MTGTLKAESKPIMNDKLVTQDLTLPPRFEDIRTLSPARISSPYNVPNSITEDDRNKLKELYENGFIQKGSLITLFTECPCSLPFSQRRC